jgi:4-amino-4-deoxy-L-arabinose transferase-like glycosyltransferase
MLAGAASWIGRKAGLGEPHKIAQFLNVPAVVGTALLVAALARLLWPERRWIAPTAVGFLVCSPVLMRTASMYNPEPVDMFVSALCLYLAARLLVGRRYGRGAAFGLGLALGAGEMVRQFSLWTLAVVVLAFLFAFWVRRGERRALVRTLVLVFVGCALVAGPWYGYRAVNYANAVFDRPHVDKPLWDRRPARFYFDPALRDVFVRPYRPYLTNLAVPQTYTDIWGDWYGVFSWSRPTEVKPPPAARAWLSAQMVLGIVPTAVAVVGWLVLLWRALRRRRPEQLLVALLPLAGIAGYLYFTVSYPTPDGDVLKPTYMLSTLGAWALCFGWFADRLALRSPRLVAGVLGITGLLVLPFVVYKGAVGWF